MREFGLVPTQFWQNAEMEILSERAKLLALYLLTSSHGNMMGCFRLPRGYLASDFHWEVSEVDEYLKELEDVNFITYDRRREWLVIHDFLTWNRIDNINHGKNVARLFEKIPPDSSVLPQLVTNLKFHEKYFDAGFNQRLHEVLIPLPTPFPIQIPTKEKDKERDKDKEKDNNACAERLADAALSKTEAVVMTVPLKDNTEFSITPTLIAEWQILYPNVDVLQSLRNIRGWNLVNKHKRKTSTGILKHITSWLRRDQENFQRKCHPPPLLEHNCTVADEWVQSTSKNVIEGEVHYES